MGSAAPSRPRTSGRRHVPAAAVAIATLLAAALSASALVDPKFTPVDLVKEADTIVSGTLTGSDDGRQWTLRVAAVLKGKAGQEVVIDFARFEKGQEGLVPTLLAQGGQDPAVLLAGGKDPDRQGFLHVAGLWLAARPAGEGRWQAETLSRRMDGVYTGGSDMLVRMVEYILAEPHPGVPAAVGTAWAKDKPLVGRVPGEIAGLAAVVVEAGGPPCVFVASDRGDRLFRPRKDADQFDDITAEMRLDARSRRFAWMDANGDGLVDLASFDGRAIRVWSRTRAGAFEQLGKDTEWPQECLGLAPCSMPDGSAAVLVSTEGLPILLHRDAAGAWVTTALPDGDAPAKAGAASCPCIVADLDNDGYFDVLQPRTAGGVLWKGGRTGLAAPVPSKVACPDPGGRFALGDFDQNGLLDIFVASRMRNALWENDGRAAFKDRIALAGSLDAKMPPGLVDCLAVDLNHDGRTDLCVLQPGGLAYHFNRGFRCFADEGGLRPEGIASAAAGAPVRCAAADFSRDGSLDLVVAFGDGNVYCCLNSAFGKPMVRALLPPGVAGPVTVSLWQGVGFRLCTAAGSAVAGQDASLNLLDPADFTVKWALPGRPARSKRVEFPAGSPKGPLDVKLWP